MIESSKLDSVWGYSYNGLPIKADYRIHDLSFNILKNLNIMPNSDILDIATGTGAFASRVFDHNNEFNVEINDFENQSNLTKLKKHSIDLNLNFSSLFHEKKYDLIIALEIIEHLENPWNFLRELKKMLKPNGYIIISTPNVDSDLDRISYLFEGHPFFFGEIGYTASGGHITQVPDYLFKIICKSLKIDIIKRFDTIDTGPHIKGSFAFKFRLFNILFKNKMKNINSRSINIYLCQ